MKKIYLFLLVALMVSVSISAQVAFLQRVDNAEMGYPAEEFNSVAQKPEKNAYDWFMNTYSASDKHVLTLQQVKDGSLLTAGAPAFKALWVNIDAVGLADLAAAGIDDDVIAAIKTYVQAGGNVLLTKQATKIVADIDRMGVRTGGYSKLEPSWPVRSKENYTTSGTIAVQPLLGSADNTPDRDASQHPIYAGMSNYNLADGVHMTYDVNSNYSWIELDRKDGSGRVGNTNIDQLNLFQSDWACSILAVQGNIGDFCLPVIMEFHPTVTYKGTVLMIGSAGYQWGSSNNALDNVKLLTSNALNYLAAGGDEYGYYMPYSLSEIYSIDQYHPEYLSAKWFYDNYVTTGTGRFIHKEEAIPAGMKVLWVHGDRQGQGKEDFYNAMGGSTFKDKLKSFVKNGGNVFLSKQATHFAYRIGRTDWEPSYDNRAYNGDAITWYMVSNFVAVGTGVDRHNHRAFHYMEEYTEHDSEGYCKWPLVKTEAGTGQHSDHKYFWGEPSGTWGDHEYSTNPEGETYTTKLARLTKFEGDYTARILGGWGHTTALDGVGMLEFLPTATCHGTIIAQGLPSYQWTTTNTAISNIQNLTRGVLEYLHNADTYTRTVTKGHYGTICLPRASESTSGATFYRAVGKILDGGTPSDVVIEEVATLEAGVPYIFEASADEITVNYTGAAVVTPDNSSSNGLIGSFIKAPIEDNPNYYILQNNELKRQNGGTNFVGEYRAYFDLGSMKEYDPSSPATAPRKRMGVNAPHVTTGMEDVQMDDVRCTKVIENGQLFILRDGAKYNVQGQIIQ